MKYKSEYTTKLIGPAQRIAELICETISYRKLGRQFWNESPWNKIYKSQLFAAYSLLKLYSEEVIMKTIKEMKPRTLRSQDFISALENKKEILNSIKETKPINTGDNKKKEVAKKGIVSKLKDYDR